MDVIVIPQEKSVDDASADSDKPVLTRIPLTRLYPRYVKSEVLTEL